MPITSVTSDPVAPTLTLVGEYGVSVERLWEAYADPRQLERFWGPETWPASFTRHDMTAGGRSGYFMTGPDGSRSAGWWRFLWVDPVRGFEVENGFAHDDGTPDEGMPSMRMTFTFEPTPSGSRVTTATLFPSLEAMQRLLEMGMLEGLLSAFGQLDHVLADPDTGPAVRETSMRVLDDTRIRVSRIVRGTVEQVWRAHQEPELLKRWLLGPAGWTMPVCEIPAGVGGGYRYEWEAEDGSARFGFVGELIESEPPHRAVTTERMIGLDGPGTINEMTLRRVEAGTLLTIVITYPSAEVRDMVLGTGMIMGMEQSYLRLETEVLGIHAV
jgi:uncharacterized protein YndB with AHSA1/START domain